MLVRTRFSNKTDIDGADHIVDAPFVGFDIETDGLYIERGARMREFAVVDRGGLRLGWSDLTSANSELSASLVARLLENLNEHIVVGHNLAFDLKFLAAEADRFDQYCPRIYCVDTLGLSRKLLADTLSNFKLAQVATHLNIELPGTLHRAEPDARLTMLVFEKLCQRFDLKTLADVDMRRFAL